MSLLDFHASKLYRQTKAEGYVDENGDYHPAESSWKFECSCDVVPTGEANKIAIPDGQVETYSYTIYNIPVCTKKFKYGDFIKLVLLGGETATLKVKGFHRYQYQCKIWA